MRCAFLTPYSSRGGVLCGLRSTPHVRLLADIPVHGAWFSCMHMRLVAGQVLVPRQLLVLVHVALGGSAREVCLCMRCRDAFTPLSLHCSVTCIPVHGAWFATAIVTVASG
jgi:hypothetical protein